MPSRLPSPGTASSQALSVKAYRWRSREERRGDSLLPRDPNHVGGIMGLRTASENGAPIPPTSLSMKWKPDCPSRKQKWITRPFTKRGNEHFDWPVGLLQADSEGNKDFLILPIFAEQTNLVTTPTRSQVKTSIHKIYWPKSNGQINYNDNGCEKGDLANATQ